MGLFKSKEERRIEREIRIKSGLKSIERSVNQQQKFAEQFIRHAQDAKRIGDKQQYEFIRNSLKKTASIKKMLERQLLAMKSAMLLQQQAAASAQFAESMNLMAVEISQTFESLDMTQTQMNWEKAVAQSSSIEERMGVFLDSMEQSSSIGTSSTNSDLVSDAEIDRMIESDLLASEKTELSKLDQLESEIAKELGATKQKT